MKNIKTVGLVFVLSIFFNLNFAQIGIYNWLKYNKPELTVDSDLICGDTNGYLGFIENLDSENTPCWAELVYLEVDGIRIMAF